MSAQAATQAPPATPVARKGRVRGLIAWVLLVVAGLLVPLGVVAFWGQRSITDTERWVTTVAPLSQDPAIRAQVAQAASDALINQVDSNNTIDTFLSALPPAAASALKTPIEAAINGLITQVVTKVVNSEQFDQLWVGANERLQSQMIAALSGDSSGAVKLEGDEVVLDIGTVIEAAKQQLIDRGVTALENKPIPPAADRQIVLLKSDQVKQAQLVYAVTIPIARFLIPALAILFLASIAISARRARMVFATGIAIGLGLLALSLGLTYARKAVTNSFADSPFQSVVETFYVTLTRYLSTAISAGITLGVVIAVLGWYGGRSRPATTLRGRIGEGLRSSGSRVQSGALAGLGGFLRAKRTWVKVAIAVLATLSLFLVEPLSMAVVLWAAAIGLLLVALVDFLAGIGTSAQSSAPGEPPAPADVSPTVVLPTTP